MINLTPAQKKAIILLSSSNLKDTFYWTGGTLLAVYYFHHRISLDLDFFSEKKFSFEDIHWFVQTLKKEADFKTVSYEKIYDRYEFFFENKESLRIEFVYYNGEKQTLKSRKKFMGIYIDSLEDIAANKTIALLDRNEAKDLFDMYFILTKGKFSARKVLNLTKKKFGISISEDMFWSKCLTTLPKIKSVKPIILEEKENLMKNIELFFKKNSRNFLNKMFR